MHARELGDPGADTIVLLHGGNVAGWMWEPQLPELADQHVLVPDFPGFGASASRPWESVDASADAVAELIASRAAGGAARIVGMSLGSVVALALAERHPDRVRSMFLASATASPAPVLPRVLARLQLAAWRRPEYWRATGRGYGFDGDDLDRFVASGLAIPRQTAERIVDEVIRGVPRERLERIATPVLAVAGGRDARFVRDASLHRIAAHLPGARVAVAPGLHHAWNAEAPELFSRATRSWFEHGVVDPELVVPA